MEHKNSNLQKLKSEHKNTHKKTENSNLNTKKSNLSNTSDNKKNNSNIFLTNESFLSLKKFLPWIILFFVILVYSNAINNGFLNWDDDRYVTANPYLALNWKNISFFFTHFYFVMYIPLTMLSYMIDYTIGGLNPWLFHLHNLILHLINTLLVYFFILKLFKKNQNRYFYAFLTALLFGIHPLHVESVSWIAERKDVLYTVFFLISLIFYLNFVEKKKKKYLLLSFISYTISLFAKTQAVVIPFILLLIDYFLRDFLDDKEKLKNFITFKDKKQWKIFIEKIPFLVVSLIFVYIAIKASATTEPLAGNFDKNSRIALQTGYNLYESIMLVSYSFFMYILELFIPFKQSGIHPYPFAPGNMLNYFYFFVIVPIIYFYLIFRAWSKKNKIIFFSLSFFISSIFIVLRIKNFIISEHYEYIPAIGIFILFSYLILNLKLKYNGLTKIIYSLTLIYIIFLGIKTYQRNFVFKDSISFWNDVSRKYPKVTVAYYNRGNYYQKMADKIYEKSSQKSIEYYNKAISDYTKTIKQTPQNIGAYSNRGTTYAKLHKYQKAINDFEKVISLDSNYSNIYSNLGNALALLGRWQQAISNYNKALKLNPNFTDALYNKAIALYNIGKSEQAADDFTKVLKANPKKFEAYLHRGISYYYSNNFNKAIIDFNHYLKLQKNNPTAIYYRALSFEKINNKQQAAINFSMLKNHPDFIQNIFNTAKNLENAGDKTKNINFYEKAISLLQNVLKIQASNSEAYRKIGVIKAKENKINKAIKYFDTAIKQDSTNSKAYVDRGYAYFLQKKIKKALRDYNTAIKYRPKNITAFYNRGILYESENNLNFALNDFNKCIELQNNYSFAYFRRAIIFLKKGQKKRACNDFRTAAKLGIKKANLYLKKYCS
jgi:tetratricopeptide (TPR) repeat protein